MTREQGTGNREEVLGNFTFRYLCRFFSVHLLNLSFIDTIKKEVGYPSTPDKHLRPHFSLLLLLWERYSIYD